MELTRRGILTIVRRLFREGVLDKKSLEAWVQRYKNPNSFNNALKAAKYLAKFLGIKLELKQKSIYHERLVTPPKSDDVKSLLESLKTKRQKAVALALITTGLRMEALLRLRWEDIDFENGLIVPKHQSNRTKLYRPQPIHPALSKILKELREEGVDKPFPFKARSSVASAFKRAGSRIRPNNLRDFFFNEARRAGMDRDILEWLMGHRLGVVQHYLADEVKEEYARFAEAVKPLMEVLKC